MIITERERIELVKRLEEAMGEKAAATLMEYLPANGWRDVSTLTDIENLRLEMRAGFTDVRAEIRTTAAELRIEMAQLESKIDTKLSQMTRTMTVAFVGGLVSFGGLLVAAAAIFKP